MALLRKALSSDQRFSHHSARWHFEDIVVEPPPAQRPHPPYWVAAGNPHSIARAGERGFNLILDQYASPETLGERIAIYKGAREAAGHGFNSMQVAVARQLYIAKDEADKHEALARQAAMTRRTVDVAKAPDGKREGAAGSHVLAYADKAGATEDHALFGTPDEIAGMLAALQAANVEYVLLQINGGADQLRRFARDIMPVFADERAAAAE
jgi:alkanesulfonate monooxygenase SsuD/methylene tetrahydromethanopterin reductase-like flavin-dependent oxidoreductase (luciferase family)